MPDDPEQRARRLAVLDSRGRRCDGAGRTCHHPATHVLMLKAQQDGHDIGDTTIRKVCHIPGHGENFRTKPEQWRILSETELGPSKYERERAQRKADQRTAQRTVTFLPPTPED